MGGLSKKAFQFQKLSADSALPHLTLDAGNLLFKHQAITPGQELEEKMTAATIVKAYNLMGYQAVCVGNRDLIAGLRYLQELKGEAKFTWLSANLVGTSSRRPLFKQSASFTVGGIKVGVIGLTGPAPLPASDGATILPWDQVLPKLAASVAKKNDLVILLSNLPAKENQRIAESYATIHLIIASGAAANTISADPLNNTVIASTGPQGKQIGIMNINWQANKRWGTQTATLLAAKKGSLDRLLWQLGKYQQDKDPETSLRDQPDRLRAYHILKNREQELRGEIDRLSREMGTQTTARSEPCSYTNRFMIMENNLPDQTEIARLVDQLDKAVFTLGQQRQAAIPSQARTESPYLGFTGCGNCHPAQLASWQKTKHAMAYQTLVKDRKQYNQGCLPCHVTGVTQSQGLLALSLLDDRRGVGCESCHGPGRLHAKAPKANAMTRKPGSAICQACHSGSHDENFDFAERIKRVGHH